MSVGVCISNYNSGAGIKDAIESILDQTYKDIHFFVVDNCSGDESIEFLKKLKKDRPELITLEILNEPEPNALVTINKALKMCPYEFALIMDDDAYLLKSDTLLKLVNTLTKNQDAAVVGANIVPYQMFMHDMYGNRLSENEVDELGVVYNIEFHGSCALFRNKMLKNAGYYNESFKHYMNELELSLLFLSVGQQVLFRSDAYAYHPRKSSIDKNKGLKYMQNYNAILRSFCDKPRRSAILSTIIHAYKFRQLKIEFIIGVACEFINSLKKPSPIRFVDSDCRYIVSETLYNNLKKCITR